MIVEELPEDEDEDEDGVCFEECPLVCVVGVVGLSAGGGCILATTKTPMRQSGAVDKVSQQPSRYVIMRKTT